MYSCLVVGLAHYSNVYEGNERCREGEYVKSIGALTALRSDPTSHAEAHNLTSFCQPKQRDSFELREFQDAQLPLPYTQLAKSRHGIRCSFDPFVGNGKDYQSD